MNDRELLEMAAKAVGLIGYIHEWINGPEFIVPGENPVTFNPLTDDGDALRLAVKLNMLEEGSKPFIELMWRLATENGKDDLEATRRAIVRAAAEIGKAMP